ncbi:hypothetical protein TSUD_96230 [Trifolium subterraneum]|nr:hypothetical protein TSUD_96230 [Trifolium subterraneum]
MDAAGSTTAAVEGTSPSVRHRSGSTNTKTDGINRQKAGGADGQANRRTTHHRSYISIVVALDLKEKA